jgi:O-antigen ligase
MLTVLALGLAVSAGFLAWRKPVLSVALVIFMNPFDWAMGFHTLTVHSNELLLAGLLLGALGQLVWQRGWKNFSWPDLAWSLPFVAALLLSLVNAAYPPNVFKQVLRFGEMALLAAWVARACGREQDVLDSLRLLIGMGLVSALVGLVQTMLGPQAAINAGLGSLTLYQGTVLRAYGTFGHPNQLAGYLILILPVTAVECLYQKNWRARLFPLGAFLVMTAALLLTFSRGAWLGLGLVSVVLYCLLVPRPWLWRGLALGAVAMVLLYAGMRAVPGPADLIAQRAVSLQHPAQEDSVHFRQVCLQTAAKMFKEHPLVGFGAGEYPRNIRRFFDERYYAWDAINKHIHNLYMQILVETGALGLAGFLTWLGYWLVVPFRRFRTLPPGLSRSLLGAVLAGVVAFLIHNNFDVLTVFSRGTHAAVLMGLGLALARAVERDENKV